jgi:hypothetical protein
MSKKKNHTAEPSKLTRFRTFEELKSASFTFPSSEPLAQLQAEYKEVIAQLRSASSAGNARRLSKTNKIILK